MQQPFEIWIGTSIDEAQGINLVVSAYPNPTTDYLKLEVIDIDLSALAFQLYNMQGRLIQSQRITGSQTSIDMGSLTPATYFLKVIQGGKEVKTFKIIKN